MNNIDMHLSARYLREHRLLMFIPAVVDSDTPPGRILRR
jgi:hypothetical protein